MKNAAFSIEELFRFLDAGVSAFHSTAAASAILEAEGYVNCPESAAWELAPGGKYYTTRNGSAVLAWRMPKGELTGWHAAASHSDSPTWRIKQFDTEDNLWLLSRRGIFRIPTHFATGDSALRFGLPERIPTPGLPEYAFTDLSLIHI